MSSPVVVHEPFEPNVGPVDRAIRAGLALALLVGAFVLLPRVDPAWILPIVLGVGPLAGYLLLTAAVETDILYHFLGRTQARTSRRAARRRARTARPLR